MIASVLSLLAAVAGFCSRLLDWMRGRKVAERIEEANKSVEDAREKHNKDATDDAFDKDYWRD